MEEKIEDYKNLTKCTGFIVIILEKTILIINDKLLGLSSELISFVNSNNVIGLKKKHLIWLELVKNYTNLCTAFNNLNSFNYNINYNRKLVIHKTAEKNKTVDKIDKKIKSIEESCNKFIEYTKTALSSLNYLSKNLDITKVNLGNKVESLNDIYQVIDKAITNFDKKFFPKVKQINKELLSENTKTGSYEQLEFLNSLTDNVKGYLTENNLNSNNYQIVGGLDDYNSNVVVGGFCIDEYIRSLYIKYELIKKDLTEFSNLESNQLDYNKLQDYYNNIIVKLQPYLELLNLNNNDLLLHIVNNSGCLTNIFNQLNTMVKVEIPKLLQYHINRFNEVNKLSIKLLEQDNETELNIVYKDSNGDLNESIHVTTDLLTCNHNNNYTCNYKTITSKVLNTITNIFNLINIADVKRILKEVKTIFKNYSEIKNVEQTNIAINDVSTDLDTILDVNNFTFENRKNSKESIKKQINLINHTINTNINVEKITLNKPLSFLLKENTNDKNVNLLNKMLNLNNRFEYFINNVTLFKNNAKNYETYFNNLVELLYNLSNEISTLINPDNKHTCIKRPMLVITTALRIVLLQNITKKRFNQDLNSQSLDNQKLNNITKNITLLNQMLECDINEFYTNELNLKKIEECAKNAVGFI